MFFFCFRKRSRNRGAPYQASTPQINFMYSCSYPHSSTSHMIPDQSYSKAGGSGAAPTPRAGEARCGSPPRAPGRPPKGRRSLPEGCRRPLPVSDPPKDIYWTRTCKIHSKCAHFPLFYRRAGMNASRSTVKRLSRKLSLAARRMSKNFSLLAAI